MAPLAMTTDEFARRASAKHGGRYDYSETCYMNAHAKVRIRCPRHGGFKQSACVHLRGNGCPECGLWKMKQSKTLTQNQFIHKAKRKYQGKFDYSQVRYLGNKKEVLIGCPIHGFFLYTPNCHLRPSGHGCPNCGRETIKRKRQEKWDDQINGLEKRYLGKTFGTVRVRKFAGSKKGKRYWKCRCRICGIKSIRSTGNLEQGSCSNCHGLRQGRVGLLERFRGYEAACRKIGRRFDLSIREFRILTSSPCHYCGKPPSQLATKHRSPKENRISHWGDYLYNGIDRKNNHKGYVLGNCLPCCKTCNRAKSNMRYSDFVAWLDRIAVHRGHYER